MTTITIQDLGNLNNLDTNDLGKTNGGWYWLYRPVPSYYFNPFVFTTQVNWASRGQAFDAQHNNFISSLRS